MKHPNSRKEAKLHYTKVEIQEEGNRSSTQMYVGSHFENVPNEKTGKALLYKIESINSIQNNMGMSYSNEKTGLYEAN